MRLPACGGPLGRRFGLTFPRRRLNHLHQQPPVVAGGGRRRITSDACSQVSVGVVNEFAGGTGDRATTGCKPAVLARWGCLYAQRADLIECTSWWWFFCGSSSTIETLDVDTHTTPGLWNLPSIGLYRSNWLEEGRYRVVTTHTVEWPGGSDSGTSGGGWHRID